MALSFLFRQGEDPVKVFEEIWGSSKQLQLRYSKRESWERLLETGRHLLLKFVQEELPRITNVQASEKRFELEISALGVPFVGIIDLVADLDGKPTVVDFKTSASAYEEHEIALSDQLSAYQLGEPEAEDVALCVFIKTKESKIEWHKTQRTADQLLEYVEKAGIVAREIDAGRFYKRPGMWCSWCDYLPVCLQNVRIIEETLVRV